MQLGWRHILIGALAVTLTACGTAPTGLAGAPRQAASLAAQSAMSEPEVEVVRECVRIAQEALAHADAVYSALKLDTAHGRKLTPEREPILQSGLVPLLRRLEHDSAAISAIITAEPTPKLAYLQREFAKRGPGPVEAAVEPPSASELLYRVAQYRLKLGFLLEYANRKGLLPAAPTWKVTPAPVPSADAD